MNTSNPEIQIPAAGRRHVRYSEEFKRQVIAACLESGVSKAAIARANGLNANMLRRWVVQSSQGRNSQLATLKTPLLMALANPDFMPVKFAPVPSAQAADIRIEFHQHASTAIQIHWPMSASSQCAQWLREVLA
jgi:transposase-like protein